MSAGPQHYTDSEALVDALIASIGKRIVLGLPLGLGKANHIANALFERAKSDSSISFRIFTALTLEKPQPKSELEARFIGPVIDRLFGDYPELAYAKALREGALPANIEVNEFFFLAGRWLSVPAAQQCYISANYTQAARYLVERGVNLVAQLVTSARDRGGERYSLSCNPDLTLELLAARAAGTAQFKLVGQVNRELPFMDGDAAVASDQFSEILAGPDTEFPLFAPPRDPISTADHAIGLHVARLISDGGTLQIGIGSIGDAVAHGLILRHRHNRIFKETLHRLDAVPFGSSETELFESGLYAASEMFVEGLLDLADAGVLKREVDGAILHAGFFVGPKSFYSRLQEMSDQERARFQMTAISFVNELYGDEAAKRRARVKARFVNNAMMATLLGATISDGLEDGRVVSGVGGQYNFVAQAFALEGARSVITLNATRQQQGSLVSNIRWSYGHETIPRHLRDIVVTEYGIADLRGKPDAAVIAAMLAIADSRFQDKLLAEAKRAGKINPSYAIPVAYRHNTPERIEQALAAARAQGHLSHFPFGTDFTATEQRLIPALEYLKATAGSRWRLGRLLARGWTAGPLSEAERDCLERMGLADARNPRHWTYRALLRAALAATASPSDRAAVR